MPPFMGTQHLLLRLEALRRCRYEGTSVFGSISASHLYRENLRSTRVLFARKAVASGSTSTMAKPESLSLLWSLPAVHARNSAITVAVTVAREDSTSIQSQVTTSSPSPMSWTMCPWALTTGRATVRLATHARLPVAPAPCRPRPWRAGRELRECRLAACGPPYTSSCTPPSDRARLATCPCVRGRAR
jgi:hypothetical protein